MQGYTGFYNTLYWRNDILVVSIRTLFVVSMSLYPSNNAMNIDIRQQNNNGDENSITAIHKNILPAEDTEAGCYSVKVSTAEEIEG